MGGGGGDINSTLCAHSKLIGGKVGSKIHNIGAHKLGRSQATKSGPNPDRTELGGSVRILV